MAWFGSPLYKGYLGQIQCTHMAGWLDVPFNLVWCGNKRQRGWTSHRSCLSIACFWFIPFVDGGVDSANHATEEVSVSGFTWVMSETSENIQSSWPNLEYVFQQIWFFFDVVQFSNYMYVAGHFALWRQKTNGFELYGVGKTKTWFKQDRYHSTLLKFCSNYL